MSRRRSDETSSQGTGGIPTGLNRIKTRPVSSADQLSSKRDGFDRNSPSFAASRLQIKQKQHRAVGRPRVRIYTPREGLRKGKEMARWFSSFFLKDFSQDQNASPSNMKYSDSELKEFDKQGCTRKLHKVGKLSTGKLSSPKSNVPKVLKSFSHELGPKGGIQPSYPRARSFDNLKELLGSFRSRFDAAKEVVNAELACFVREMMHVSEKDESLPLDGHKMTEELLILAQQCIEMTSLEFRRKCEEIVQDLTGKRQQCETGLLKWLLTRMLFILTRCTRTLNFEKDNEPINEKSINKFKECLDRIPSVDMSWVIHPGIVDSKSDNTSRMLHDLKYNLLGQNRPLIPLPAAECCGEVIPIETNTSLRNDFVVTEQKSAQNSQTNILDDNFYEQSINEHCYGSVQEQVPSPDESDLVICRICEELVPTPHLEPHSYICAYTDKCDMKFLDVDERLLKLAELLEQITESRNSNVQATYDGLENLRMKDMNSTSISEGHSPKITEWRSKGVEGMFEDIHEMDTAGIEDSNLAPYLRNHLGLKLGQGGPPSSTGSMTSASSTNTPRAGNFEFLWLEQNNFAEFEDVQQMTDLVDIARCVAGTDTSKQGSYEFLLACLHDLQDVLQCSKLKALVIDTCGGRLENLLREKLILACQLEGTKCSENGINQSECSELSLDNASPSRAMSTPLLLSHKERTSIDDFEIIKPISRGAFGKVFLARKRTTGDFFAIKALKKLDMIRKNDIEHILAERNILITVRNPFVVRFFYSFTSRENLYLVMEYLNGGDLFSLLRKVGCLEEDVARIYIAELVLALEYLHSLGIVHRDLKPDNILIAHDGHIKLTDFGLSKFGLMNSTGDLSGPSMEGKSLSDAHDQHIPHALDKSQRSAVGTPDYLAPEILLGTEHGYAADWWSVGIILFEFITGIPPFTAEHPEMIFDNILNRKIPWPSVPNDMSHEAQDLIDRFLVHDPDYRLGAKGSSEVKVHPFFQGISWDNLALQKAAFVPHPESVDDTSYFVSRYHQIPTGTPDEDNCSNSASDTTDFYSDSAENMEECGDVSGFDSCPLDLSLINFSFKNLSQLASINHDVLLQSGKDSSKCSSPSRDSYP